MQKTPCEKSETRNQTEVYVCPEKLAVVLVPFAAAPYILLSGNPWGLPDGVYRRVTPSLLKWLMDRVESAKARSPQISRSSEYLDTVLSLAAERDIEPAETPQAPEPIKFELDPILEDQFWKVTPKPEYDYWSTRSPAQERG